MPRIPESEIERIKREVDLIALVQSRGIKLEKHGSKDWKGLCPFHGDKETPNLIVTPARGLFHCMACGKAGNALQFVQQYDGVSFRHAFEVLNQGGAAAFSARPLTKQATVPVLPCPLDAELEDAALLGQVVDYYHQRLKQSSPALEYLASRGLSDAKLIEKYHLGYADRSLGLRMPEKNRKEGEALRSRLMQLGLWRESGHEHFNGCIVVPLQNKEGHCVAFYGRRIGKGTIDHLYSPGPHRGLFNRAAFESDEIILCEAVLDALTFCAQGITNVSTLYGTEGFTDELAQALGKVRRVKLAYDADEAGERAAARDAVRLQSLGIEVWRVKFPWGMDANEYARKVTPAGKSLALLLNAAQWMGKGQGKEKVSVAPMHPAMEQDTALHPCLDTSYPPGKGEECPESGCNVTLPSLSSSLVAASVSSLEGSTANEKKVPGWTPVRQGEDLIFDLGQRSYRVRGFDKNNSCEVMRINLRVLQTQSGLYHVNVIDLYQARQRQAFIEEAAQETLLEPELLKRDLGKLLLALETLQQERLEAALKSDSNERRVSVLTPEEEAEAMALLKNPRLLEKIVSDFTLIGEGTNKLAGYLGAVSRLLKRPLAIIIQSTSAAGKSSLMDAILKMMPEESLIKYSAMTGQSLYYLGEKNLKNKILAIVEEEGAEKASYALKLLQSEGELIIASTGKDPQTGLMVTQEYRVEGPVMIILTTTAVDIDEEFLNRSWVLTVDESRKQTEAIHKWQREAETLEGLERELETDGALRVHRNAQRLLRSIAVVNPYAPELTFTSERTRARRDHAKYLTLIRTVALLHQYQREVKISSKGTPYIEVTLEDIGAANAIAHELLGRSLDELPPQTRKLLGALDAYVEDKCMAQKLERTDFIFSRREIREALGWGDTQLKIHLARLVDMEYLALHRHPQHGQSYLYELLGSGFSEAHGKFFSGLIGLEALIKMYDENRSEQNHNWSALNKDRSVVGRPLVGGVSGGGRDDKTALEADKISVPVPNGQFNHQKTQARRVPVVAS